MDNSNRGETAKFKKFPNKALIHSGLQGGKGVGGMDGQMWGLAK